MRRTSRHDPLAITGDLRLAWGPMGAMSMDVTFRGVRGSTPCHCPETARYGGNTSCVSLHVAGQQPLILDLGTGLQYLGQEISQGQAPFHGTALLSHLHWDHVQGLPFFAPMMRDDAILDVYGPAQEDGVPLHTAIGEMIRPPMFPLSIMNFPGTFRFIDLADNDFSIGEFKIRSRQIPHVGNTLGFRVEIGGISVAYLSDHQQPYDGSHTVIKAVHELVDDCDLLIHDSQYSPEEFQRKFNWGHCTPDFAITVATECRAKRLAMFHHDPLRHDSALDALAKTSVSGGLEIIVAAEGMTLTLQ